MAEHRTSQRFLIELNLLNELSAYADKTESGFSDLINQALREFLQDK
jgi:metal-responsive CopG/Arc/MetJ family transcriptional regulator